MILRKIVAIFILLPWLFSCVNSKDNNSIKPPVINHADEFKKFFVINHAAVLQDDIYGEKIDSLQWLDSLYADLHYKSIWISDSITLNKLGKQLIAQLSESKKFGLDTRLYPVNLLLRLENTLDTFPANTDKYMLAAKLDALLSYNYMRHGKHLNYGLLDSISPYTELSRRAFTINLPDYLHKAYKSDSLIVKLLALQPKHKEYHNIQLGLAQFLEKDNLSTNSVPVINFREDSLKAVRQARKALINHGYLTENDTDSMFISALKKFQKSHGLHQDGLVGTNTAKALSLSPYEYYQQMVANMERWRWRDPWKPNRLYVNIPEYILRIYKNDSLVKKHFVVVGSRKNQTPELLDSLAYIIAYPYWNVPKRISVNEILKKARKDSTYMKRNKYEVLTKVKDFIDPDSINWKKVTRQNFDYRIRQRGGAVNALGYVKFIFPNKNAIYLHDTPSKSHFYHEKRAYSHGCVRVQDALKLADYLLEEDENRFTIDTVNAYIKKRKEKWISMQHKMAIYFYYATIVADEQGTVTFYDDVYDLNKPLIKALSGIFAE
ncbi:MAG: hypothetical protein CR985_00045 [Flavobacteriales bacterium]|nr:MAG: hypothetical protein CR985_00045 [Flavobacteriales bacterium]